MTTTKNEAKVREIPVERLLVSPEETRKTIDQASLEELAKSIAKDGVIEALLVRPVLGDAFEIVAGQRRWLASKLAGKATVPCVVREMQDEEARFLRIVSNEQREDLPPMEQAEAYGKLLERPGATVESIAAALAKSPSYIGRRVQLLKAIEPVRQALKAGAIEVGHALELARLDDARQRRMLTRMQCGATLVEPEDVEDESGESGVCRFCGCTEDDACEGTCSWANEEQTVCTNPECLERFRAETLQENESWHKTHYSVVELRREIAETAYIDLKNAPFPLIDEIPPMACTECPKRAGNALLLFDDCAQDTCTDRSCYYRKVNAWIDAGLQKAKNEKRKLLKLTGNWTSDKGLVYCGEYHGVRVFKNPSECQDGEEGIWIDGRNVGRRATICRNQKCETHFGKRASHSSGQERSKKTEQEKTDRRKVLDKVKAEKAYRGALFAALLKATITTEREASLHLDVCAYAIDKMSSLYSGPFAIAMGWDKDLFGYGQRAKLRKKLGELTAAERLRVVMLSAAAGELSVQEYAVNSKPDDLELLAKGLSVDCKKIRANLAKRTVDKPASKAAKALEAAKTPANPNKAKKQVLTAAAKKRIADAQKKRWASVKKVAKKGGAK